MSIGLFSRWPQQWGLCPRSVAVLFVGVNAAHDPSIHTLPTLSTEAPGFIITHVVAVPSGSGPFLGRVVEDLVIQAAPILACPGALLCRAHSTASQGLVQISPSIPVLAMPLSNHSWWLFVTGRLLVLLLIGTFVITAIAAPSPPVLRQLLMQLMHFCFYPCCE